MGPSDLLAFVKSFAHFIGIGLAVKLAVTAIICWFLDRSFRTIPPKHRTLSPQWVWLLMIPVFNWIWNFWVFPGLSKSFKSYFDSVGDKSVGDCYLKVARWFSVAGIVFFVPIPLIEGISALAYIILMMIYLIRVGELREKIAKV